MQTIEGMRLNNLCANGAYSGVYWNDGSFQEFSYVTGADSAEMGQGGMRVNMVPKDGGNSFHGFAFGNYSPSVVGVGQLRLVRVSASRASAQNLTGDTTFNKTNNFLTNVSKLTKNYDFNTGVGGPIVSDQAWFYRHVPLSRREQDGRRQLLQPQLAGPRQVHAVRAGHEPSRRRRRPHPQHRGTRRRSSSSSKDQVSYYHDEQDKVRGHWGIASTIPPEASAIQATPTSFVSVTKYTRTQSNKLMFDAGLARLRPGISGELPA